MGSPDPIDGVPVHNRWDRFLALLSAPVRRQIVVSLMDASDDRWLPLPDAAVHPERDVDPERLETSLQHNHLPKLADAGYVSWRQEPFGVQRGPRFQEPARVMRSLLSSQERLPPEVANAYKLEEVA